MAALRPGRHAVHPVRPVVRLPGHTGAAAQDPQAEQVQDRVHGHTDMQGRPDLLRGHTGRADQGLLRAQGQPDHRDGGRNRRDPDAARGGGLRADQLDHVAHARGVLRDHHTERVAQVRARRQGADRRRGRPLAGRRLRDRRVGRERRVRHQERSQGHHTLEVVVQEFAPGRRVDTAPVQWFYLFVIVIYLFFSIRFFDRIRRRARAEKFEQIDRSAAVVILLRTRILYFFVNRCLEFSETYDTHVIYLFFSSRKPSLRYFSIPRVARLFVRRALYAFFFSFVFVFARPTAVVVCVSRQTGMATQCLFGETLLRHSEAFVLFGFRLKCFTLL